MDYRRGFQRVYAVLTVAWVLIVLAVAFRDRPLPHKPDIWERAAALPPAKDQPEIDPKDLHPTVLPEDFLGWQVESEAPTTGAILRHWGKRSALAVLAPAAGYLFLFMVIPWIYRGFKPRTI
jgi:hypothetical protein